MNTFSNSDKLKAFIAPNITYLITLLDNNGISVIYIGVNIHRKYFYLDMIGVPTNLNYLNKRSHPFGKFIFHQQ